MSSAVQGRFFDIDDIISPPRECTLAAAVEHLASENDANMRGAVYTRREVIDFILDLVGYRPDLQLFRYRILEPSFGAGDFLTQIVARLLSSFTRHGSGNRDFQSLRHVLRAVELHSASFDATRARIVNQLTLAGMTPVEAVDLVGHWLVRGDFLLTPLEERFDFVVGNPPYVRQERIPKTLMAEYRHRYRTIYDRADLYIPFIERSLSLLGTDGAASFICSDRWMKNRYGSPLRAFVADKYQLQCYVDMVDTDAFHADVTAYPAITVFRRGHAGVTRIARKPRIDVAALSTLAHDLVAEPLPSESPVVEAANVVNGGEPWLLDALSITETVRRLEKQYPTLEEADCKVGIGVATGADQAFIGEWDALDVEDDRKLPLATTDDIRSGEVTWRGRGVINPFAADGRLVELHRYPRLAQYLEERRDIISRRHCAKKTPAHWYRTIDRIWNGLAETPKLLIPDIKGAAHVVYEEGRLYPHHNLYYITSSTWDLRALQAVLLSRLSQAVVATYSTKMRGGYLRFQAQYLRRIRLPRWSDVAPHVRRCLIDAAEKRDIDTCNDTTFDLYGLTAKERAALLGAGV